MVNIDVDDLDKAIDFYRTAFGLRLGRRFSGAVAEMLGGSSPVYLPLKPPDTPVSAGAAQRRTYGRHWTPVHLDFVVENIGTAVSAARSAGAALERDIQTHTWGRLALMADPFGNGFWLDSIYRQRLRRGRVDRRRAHWAEGRIKAEGRNAPNACGAMRFAHCALR